MNNLQLTLYLDELRLPSQIQILPYADVKENLKISKNMFLFENVDFIILISFWNSNIIEFKENTIIMSSETIILPLNSIKLISALDNKKKSFISDVGSLDLNEIMSWIYKHFRAFHKIVINNFKNDYYSSFADFLNDDGHNFNLIKL